MKEWNNHYIKEKSALDYPDENLVRLFKKAGYDAINGYVLDSGCGSGRHLKLLSELGAKHIIGTDLSPNAIYLSGNSGISSLIQASNSALPFKDNRITSVIAWGSLHYCTKKEMKVMVSEIHRILKPGGFLFATLRSSFDTWLRSGTETGNNEWVTDLKDISGSTVSFSSEDEVKNLLRPFSYHTYGLIERTSFDDISKRISHWVIQAVK